MLLYKNFWHPWNELLSRIMQRGVHVDISALQNAIASVEHTKFAKHQVVEQLRLCLDRVRMSREKYYPLSRIHTLFSLSQTGLLRSRSPNLDILITQAGGLPFDIRSVFAAAPGKRLIVVKFQHLELRILSYLSGCPNVLSDFLGSPLKVIPRSTSHMRDPVKEGNGHGTDPGEGKKARLFRYAALHRLDSQQLTAFLRSNLGPVLDGPLVVARDWDENFCKVSHWTKRVLEPARSYGCVQTILGRGIFTPRLKNVRPSAHPRAEIAALRSLIDGSRADVLVLSMLALEGSEPLKALRAATVMNIQDEIVLEVPEKNATEAAATVVKLLKMAVFLPIAPRNDLAVTVRVAEHYGEAAAPGAEYGFEGLCVPPVVLGRPPFLQ